MQRAYRAHAPPSQQNKVVLQRAYREKELECFNTLRHLIRELTGEELRTRQEILRKAITLLTASEGRQRGGCQADVLTPPDDGTSSALAGYFTQSPDRSQSWQSSAEFHPSFPSYGVPWHTHNQHFLSGMDSTFNPPSSPRPDYHYH